MRTSRFGLIVSGALVAMMAAAGADESIEPGQWKITTKIRTNGGTMPPEVKARCLTPEQAGDLGKTFGPVMTMTNSTCERTAYDATGRRLKWRMQCRGQIDMDVAGDFDFDTSSHYTATVVTKAWMAGMLMNDVTMELEGEHLGDCQK
ncbi:MAG: DUF3617 family protein [Bradyrhizobium sp.]|uniref:DUF3617 domain-containing protein n=1 Tax=Bradyrhizobium sp. TaxID=376 RepID=UPI001EBCE7C2|nr:DUF3617 family protein [Bradyrhizobium sp.]MBU6456629.1 DUF3617 family protein [Bradyrhizobium sp.]MDE2330058.1 DUF3617 family protein [Bradyrhizobium sp.]MDE2602167.1 DUF3617 family protein [Bradyrhizobium sp.]